MRRVSVELARQNVRAFSAAQSSVHASIVKNMLQGDLDTAFQKKIKGVHLDAISDFFKACDNGSLKKSTMVSSLSNLAYVSGYRRETKSLLDILGSKILIVPEAFNADDFVTISYGLKTMLSSDVEVRNMLANLTNKLESLGDVTFTPAQFSQIMKSMSQLSSKDSEVSAFLGTVVSRVQKSSFSDAEIANSLSGLHNMSADSKTTQDVLTILTEQLKGSTLSGSHNDFDVALALSGLASMSGGGASKASVSALVAQLAEKIRACITASVFDEAPMSFSGISSAWFGLQTLLVTDAGMCAPLVSSLNEIIALQANKAPYPVSGKLFTPRELGNLLYCIKDCNWTGASGDVMKPTIGLVQASLRNLLINNNRALLQTNVTSRDPQLASVQSVKEVAYLLQCVNIALIINATATPRQNPHLGAYADVFVPDTLATIPSKLPEGLKKSLVRAETMLQTHMNSNAACQQIPYTVRLPTETLIADEFSRILRETKAKPKISHRVYLWGTPCDVVIRGNFKYVFNIEYDDRTHCALRQSYPLQQQFEVHRDKSLRFNAVKIIRISEDEYSTLLSDSDETDRLGVIRDKLFDEVEDDISEQSYTTFDDDMDTNDSIVKNLEAKKKAWAGGK